MRNLAFFSLLALPVAASAVPLELAHQGRIFDQAGLPLDGAHDLALRLYDAPSGGTPLWQEDHVGQAFDDGYFAVDLGSNTALDAATFDDDDLWLAIEIDSGGELPTRIALRSVPFAIRAASADGLAAGTVVDASEIRIGGTTVIDGSGTFTGTVSADADSLADITGCANGEVLTWTGAAWDCGAAGASTFDASAIVTGTLDINRLPVGGSAGTVSAGDHNHAISALTGVAAISQIPVGSTSSHVAAGDHSHDLADLTGVLTATDPGDAFCNASNLGAIRFVADVFEGCTSGGWTDIGGFKPGVGDGAGNAGASCDAIHSAYPAQASGRFWVDPDGSGGNGAFEIWCDMSTEGGGWYDLVGSFNAGLDGNALMARFFQTNGVASTVIEQGSGNETTSGNPGFHISNTGASPLHTRGFHFGLNTGVPYSQVRLDYRMQGSQNDSNRCSTGSWVPLSGPGYNGGYTGYPSPCPGGYTCVQGTSTANRDLPIQATYSNDSVNSSNTLLTWSNSVSTQVSDSCARDPEIPVGRPTVFFTEFRFK